MNLQARTDLAALLEALEEEAIIGVTPSGTVFARSAGAAAVLGEQADNMLGRPLAELAAASPLMAAIHAAGSGGAPHAVEITLPHSAAGAVRATVVPAPADPEGSTEPGWWIIARRSQGSDRLAERSGREKFTASLAERLAPAAPPDQFPGVLLVEVDGLKTVNELLGNHAGDRLLAEVGRRLAEMLEPGVPAARLHGAAFGVLFEPGTEEMAEAFAGKVRERLEEPVDVGPSALHPVVHLGFAGAQTGDGPDDVLRRANVALLGARQTTTRWQMYVADLLPTVAASRSLDFEVREAVARRELLVYYQPVVDLRDQQVVGAEALVRWRDRRGALVMPGDFIEAAENSGAILGIGLWVFEEACRQMAEWNERYRPSTPLEVGINLSVRQLANRTLAAEFAEVLGRISIEPAQVTLEITESAVMDDAEKMIERLHELKKLGLTLSMDDFGTGYSSLSYLRRLPVDILKIDRSFVDGIARSDEEWALAVAIVKLATSLGKRTVAEGVETGAQVAHLRALQCELAQGYLFARPLPAEEFETMLRVGAPA